MPEAFHITVTVNSAAPLRVLPLFGYAQRDSLRREDTRLQGGALRTWRFGRQAGFDAPLEWVSSADAAFLRSAWRDGREVIWTINASTSPQSWVCQVTNQEEPFPQRSGVNYSDFRGILFLRETNGAGRIEGGPFIMDDATWGIMDGTYNLILGGLVI